MLGTFEKHTLCSFKFGKIIFGLSLSLEFIFELDNLLKYILRQIDFRASLGAPLKKLFLQKNVALAILYHPVFENLEKVEYQAFYSHFRKTGFKHQSGQIFKVDF